MTRATSGKEWLGVNFARGSHRYMFFLHQHLAVLLNLIRRTHYTHLSSPNVIHPTKLISLSLCQKLVRNKVFGIARLEKGSRQALKLMLY